MDQNVEAWLKRAQEGIKAFAERMNELNEKAKTLAGELASLTDVLRINLDGGVIAQAISETVDVKATRDSHAASED